ADIEHVRSLQAVPLPSPGAIAGSYRLVEPWVSRQWNDGDPRLRQAEPDDQFIPGVHAVGDDPGRSGAGTPVMEPGLDRATRPAPLPTGFTAEADRIVEREDPRTGARPRQAEVERRME